MYKIALRFGLKIISIDELVAYRMQTERLVKRVTSVQLPTRFGEFEVIAFEQIPGSDIHLAFKHGDWTEDEPILVRVHSSSEAGDIIGNLFEEQGLHHHQAIQAIQKEGKGVVLMQAESRILT